MSERALNERWDDVLADADATVAEYRDQGWEAIGVHPGDVNPVADAGRLDVLLPGSEFDEVRDRMDAVDIDTFRVYAAYQSGVGFRLVAAEDADSGFALCIPTYLADPDAEPLRRAAMEAGEFIIRLRPLDDRDVVELTLSDPEPFFDAEPAE
ncbi:DUF7529 family protein [Halorubrum sp. DTA98]|uniref:DUF7529 family protein n=1 Tax=Halorubrum sp. DTA98 TaxID=3402163 RepID=UPI003AAFF261